MSSLRDRGEGELIRYLTRAFQPAGPLELGIGDDAAVFAAGPRVVAAADTMVEGVHFDFAWCGGEDVGWKLVAVNVSDLAAMGAKPEHALFTLSAPATLAWERATGLVDGVAAAARQFGLSVVGGDVTGSPGPVMLSLTLLGRPAGDTLTRDAARPGHGVYVTGHLGLSGAGFEALRADAGATGPHVQRFLRPAPRLAEGLALSQWSEMGAMMDLSDGLGVDAARMASRSGCDLVIERSLLPALHGERLAVHFGEDYELLFTCSAAPPVEATRIGRVESGTGQLRWEQGGQPCQTPPGRGFGHFGE